MKYYHRIPTPTDQAYRGGWSLRATSPSNDDEGFYSTRTQKRRSSDASDENISAG